MLNIRKPILLACACAVILPVTGALAATTTIQATAEFLAAMTLGNQRDMDFGSIEFSGRLGQNDTVSLGTNGVVNYAGAFSGTGRGNAGQVEIIGGTTGRVVEIFCQESSALGNSGGDVIEIVGIEVSMTGVAYGAGSRCAGPNVPAMSHQLGSQGGSVIRIGGKLDGSTVIGDMSGGDFDSQNGGSDIQIDVLYQ